jgi:omega-6 fatty acid desaturase (delta-12 desaturase)
MPLDTSQQPLPDVKKIAAHCQNYKGAQASKAIFQMATTIGLFLVGCVAMFYSLNLSYWLTLLLAIPTAGVMARIFIFQHDCGHGSFFNSKKTNDWVGRAISLITIVPYDFWRKSHNFHHATSGDLDRGGVGDIDVLTVREYKALSPMKQRIYRLYRNPFVLLMIGTPIYIMFLQRIPYTQSAYFRENGKVLSRSSIWKSIMLTNLSIFLFYGSLSLIFGFTTVISIALPIWIISAWFYGWAFYVQHQFEETYFEESEEWSIQEAALLGSSYYALPKVLQWFSGNIGIHHVHHLCSKIPNYKLQECIDDMPELKNINKLTFMQSLKCGTLKLWDEDSKKLVKI